MKQIDLKRDFFVLHYLSENKSQLKFLNDFKFSGVLCMLSDLLYIL